MLALDGYTCGEQYIMRGKAKLFGNKERYNRILASTDPSVSKYLGRGVRSLNHAQSELHRDDIALAGKVSLRNSLEMPKCSRTFWLQVTVF